MSDKLLSDKLVESNPSPGFQLSTFSSQLLTPAFQLSVLRNCSAVILAGGRSSRMGSDKALLEYSGQPALEYIATQLRGYFSDIVISVNREQCFSVAGCRSVTDGLPDFGPLAGISAGLRAARNETVFVIAVDSPKVNFAVIEQLVATLTVNHIAVMPEINGQLEPLYAAYSKRALPDIDALISANIHRVTALNDSGRVARLVLDIPEAITNINTRADYENICRCQPAAVVKRTISRYQNGRVTVETDELITEQRVLLSMPAEHWFLCTPVDLQELIFGWCYSRDLITKLHDVLQSVKIDEFSYRVLLATQVESETVSREFCKPENSLMAAMQRSFFERQAVFRRTGAAHAAGFFDITGNLLSFFEDIGRHNALDKAIGALVLSGLVQDAAFLLLSSRVSVELLEKIRRVPVGAVCAVSAPSNAAVDLANQLGLVLIGFFRDNRYNLYNDKETNHEDFDC